MPELMQAVIGGTIVRKVPGGVESGRAFAHICKESSKLIPLWINGDTPRAIPVIISMARAQTAVSHINPYCVFRESSDFDRVFDGHAVHPPR